MNISEEIREVVNSMRSASDGPPYFMYGHRSEIAQRLSTLEKDPIKKRQRYPIIILILDNPGRRDGDMIRYNLHLAVMTYRKGPINAEQRIVGTIEPILYPIYDKFLSALTFSGKFTWPGDPLSPPHTMYERPFWGTPGNEKNERQYFSDPVDAIELVNLEINAVLCVESAFYPFTEGYFERPYFENEFE